MARVQLETGEQARFLQAVRNATALTWNEIAAYVNLCFTSYSAPLLQDVVHMLTDLRFHPTTSHKRKVYLRRQKEVDRYYQEVGTRNLYHLERYRKFSNWREKAGQK